MTPTEQDNELRIAIYERMIAFRREEGNGYADRCIEHLDSVMQLITADRKRVALEARIGELENNKWLPNEAKWIEQEAERIAELKAQQEEV